MHLAFGSATDVGRVRRVNEDSLLAEPPVFLVADGMGGHAAGDVASAIVVEEFTALTTGSPVAPRAVGAALSTAHRRVRSIAGPDGVPLGAGTTVAAVVEVAHQGRPSWLVLNVGDSRVYGLVGGDMEQLTVDHSLVQELVDDGVLTPEQARYHPQRNVVTRAVGTPGRLEPDAWLLPPDSGQRLLVCSDGLTGELTDDEVRAVLAAEATPQEAADALVRSAVEAGGHDNVSVVVVDVLDVPTGAPADAGGSVGADVPGPGGLG